MTALAGLVSQVHAASVHRLGRGRTGGNWALLMAGAALTVIAGIQAAAPRRRWHFSRFARVHLPAEIGPRAAMVRRNVGLVLSLVGLVVVGYALTRL